MTVTEDRDRSTVAAEARWGRIPAWWLDHPEVDADALAVLATLATYADRSGRCWPSQTTLAMKLKRSRSWVGKIVARLSVTGILKIEDRWSASGGRLSSLYVLTFGEQPAGKEIPVAVVNTPATDDRTPCHAEQHEQSPEQNPDSRYRRARETSDVPVDWMPSANDAAWAKVRFPELDLAAYTEKFQLRCQAHGYRYKNVGAAWRSWLAEDALNRSDRKPSTTSASLNRQAAAEQSVNAWMSAALIARNTPTRSQSWL